MCISWAEMFLQPNVGVELPYPIEEQGIVSSLNGHL